ncbi:dihydroxyacetone kinase family protein [Acrocarpospora macrocephala]|uniref:Erythrulose kinase n=1 Tax=Acrocarpospora macrocephala TaxID=150177 RepID=A0A5M3WPI6_9ACTN|nr:dihydroxyacetone kinase family protein [Acrocarpospora macrocephala]GES11247.1 erythrulose kinase [Acrocarpospora macrocephala]
MTHVYNAETGFKDEFLDGLTAAYGRYLRRVPSASGVMSVTAPARGRASVLIGGGSGHYPAFAGLVGPGLCDGAVVGDVFTSPSAEHVYRCIKALDGSAGVLLSFGNYSGDVMHFGAAVERARREGVDARIVLVTDDVASAPSERRDQRRGIAGGFFVFRAASAAAHAGLAMDDLEALAHRVNAATFTFGVAFGGCTFPGRSGPLFTVKPGQMELGLGIHGEPGIETTDWVPATRLAELLVAPLLRERPDGGRRALVLLNGLGNTKYEELFVLYRDIDAILAREGVEVVRPEVGEYVTSLDMAGCSLTLCWLDPEIEPYLDTPAAAPGYRTGQAVTADLPAPGYRTGQAVTADLPAPVAASLVAPVQSMPAPAQAMPASVQAVAASVVAMAAPVAEARADLPRTGCADVVAAMIAEMAEVIEAIEPELGRLDAVAGDGDHGAGMVRGFRAAVAATTAAGPHGSDVLTAAGAAFSEAAGGASGALWGAGLAAAGAELATTPSVAEVHTALAAALAAITGLGGARVGDKTMVDALAPFVATFGASRETFLPRVWREAATVAAKAAADTADLAGRKGRAAVHGARSLGTPDPGAVSLAAALSAAGRILERLLKEDT